MQCPVLSSLASWERAKEVGHTGTYGGAGLWNPQGKAEVESKGAPFCFPVGYGMWERC